VGGAGPKTPMLFCADVIDNKYGYGKRPTPRKMQVAEMMGVIRAESTLPMFLVQMLLITHTVTQNGPESKENASY
jgi:hypothetical protein